MKTITILIGNSDDKLTQKDWATFSRYIESAVKSMSPSVHFNGRSLPDDRWQNAAWVIEIEDDQAARLKEWIREIKAHYKQESVAWIEGTTEMI